MVGLGVVDLNHRPCPYQGHLWCYMHSSVAMITLLTTSLMVTSWHDCWFQVARSVQSGDHFLQADFGYLSDLGECLGDHALTEIRRFQMADKPPSTDNSTPFTKLESSEARNSATRACVEIDLMKYAFEISDVRGDYLRGCDFRRFAGTPLRLLVTGFVVLAASNKCRMPC